MPAVPPKNVTKENQPRGAPPSSLFTFMPGAPPPTTTTTKGAPPPIVFDPDDPTRPKGANSGEAVYRADGTRLYGIDAELEKKV